MPYVPIDLGSIKLDSSQGGPVPVDINTIKMDPPPPTATTGDFQSSVPGRVLHGAMDPAFGISQAVPHAIAYATSLGGTAPNAVSHAYDQSAQLLDQGNSTRETDYQNSRTSAGQSGMDWARLGGNIVSPVNLAVGGEVAGLMPEATTLGAKLAQGATMGSVYGATTPVDTSDGSYATQKAWQAGIGGVTGAAAPLVGSAVSSIMKPNISDDAQLLMDEGIRLTPGQRNGGTMKSLEDKFTSIPIVGDIIKNAQGRSIQDLNTAVANRALNPIGEKLPEGINGRDAVSYVKDTLGNKYNNLLPKLTATPDSQFGQDMQGIQKTIQDLPAQEQKTYANILEREIANRSKSGSLAGQDLKDAQTGLSNEIKDFSPSTDPYQRKLAQALKDTQDSLRGLIGRSNPQYAGELEKIDEGYANYARMRSASSMIGAEQGTFTPGQLSNAVRSADKTVGHGGYATGNAYMQDLSDAAKAVLPNKYPDSGTAGRYLASGLLGGQGMLGIPLSIGAGIPTAAIYSNMGTKLGAALSQRPAAFKPVADAISKYSNPAALARALVSP